MENYFWNKYKGVIGLIGAILFCVALLCLLSQNVGATVINITPISITSSSIEWNWTDSANITSLSIDGSLISTVDNTTSLVVINNLQPITPHIIKIKFDNGDSGTNQTLTLGIPLSSADKTQDFIWQYLLLFVAIILCVVGIIVPVVGMIGFLFALLFLIQVAPSGNIYLDLMAFSLMVTCSCVTYIGVKR